MMCPEDHRLLLHVLGELSVNESRRLDDHLEACGRCRAMSRELLQFRRDLMAPPASRTPDDVFLGGVLDACAGPQPGVGRAPRARHWPRWALGMAAAFVAGLVVAREAEPARPLATWQARGGAQAPAASPSAEIFRVRDGVFSPVGGAVLRSGDALAVRYSHPSPQPSYLTVFVLDAQGQAHWIYPAYVDPRSNPPSRRVQAGVHDRFLEEMVEPASPAPGRLRVFALFSKRPLRVREVEAQLSDVAREGAARVFPNVLAQEWEAMWKP